ncbi:hypothetical protein [Embleya sp. NPDC001921]
MENLSSLPLPPVRAGAPEPVVLKISPAPDPVWPGARVRGQCSTR